MKTVIVKVNNATQTIAEHTVVTHDLCCQQRRKTFGRFHQAA